MAQTAKPALEVTRLSDTEVRLTRTFNAPVALVFEAYSRCEHVQHWWGMNQLSVCEMDFRVGGKWRFVERSPEGTEDGFRGEFREIVLNTRIAQTFEWEGMPGHISLDTAEFSEVDGRTLLVATSKFDSKEDLDGMMASGMEVGAGMSYDRLDAYVQTLKP